MTGISATQTLWRRIVEWDVYSWQPDYIAALLETDKTKAARRLYEAIAAIEQRLLSPVEPGSKEEHALIQAPKVIAVLREQHAQ